MVHPGGSHFGLFVAGILIAFTIGNSWASDRSILLEIAALANGTLPQWNAQNTQSICEWDRVVCDVDGRVKELYPSGSDDGRTSLLVGSLPQSIAQLDRLEVLSLQNNNIYGDLPEAFWLLPNLTQVFLVNTGLTISFPPNISKSIVAIAVAQAKVISRVPEADWDRFQKLDLEATGIKCPLPAGLVAHMNSGKNFTECGLNANYLTIDQNNMLCGQVNITKMKCLATPLIHTAPFFATDDTQQVTTFAGRLGNFTLEFTQDEVMIFSTYSTRKGVRKEYRREYLSFRLMPITDIYGPDYARQYVTAPYPYWRTYINEGNRIRANTTNTDSLVQEYIFELKLGSDGPYIKVSNNVYNFGHRWALSPGRVKKATLSYVFSFRVAHSPSQGEAITCTRGLLSASSCSSSVATLNSILDLTTGQTPLVIRTRTAEFRYVYGTTGSVDGVPLYSDSASIFVARFPAPLQSSRWLEINRRAGFTLMVNNLTEAEQSFAALVEVKVPDFRDTFFFDPDVSITLLFDPNDNVAPETTDDGVLTTTPVALIVGLVVGVVVVIAGVTIFTTVIFPYMQQRKNAAKTPLQDVDTFATSEAHPRGSWQKSTTPPS